MPNSSQQLTKIFRAIVEDKMNAQYTQKGWEPVYSAHPQAKIVIIGQAPGRKAQEGGVPWDDRSGDRLRDWIGVDRETFYDQSLFSFLPMDFYFPGTGKSGDLPPRTEFAKKWHAQILALMPEIRLKILIGQYAQKYYLMETPVSVTDTIKEYRKHLKNGIMVLPHPSPRNQIWQKKNPWFDKEVLPKLRREIARLLS